jgi:dihydrofolate reductase
MKIIAAIDKNRGIGKNGCMLVHLPADLKQFKDKTINKTVVMGRRTFESLPGHKPLANRANIVLTRHKGYNAGDAIVVNDLDELFSKLEAYDTDDVFVIGGEQIYKAMLKYCETAYVTLIDASFDADAFFPDIDSKEEWEIIDKSEKIHDNGYDIIFLSYRNKHPVTLTLPSCP